MTAHGSKAGAEAVARTVFTSAAPEMCMGVKPAEPVFTAAEQVDRMAARAGSR